jgi:transcriptional regulator with XRE-family HTH domain
MSDETSLNLATNVRRLREKRALTQQELAELSGVPRPTIANLESGTANPTLSVLLRVADTLAASVEELVRPESPRSTLHRARSLPERKRGGATVRRLLPGGARPAEFERIELLPGARLGSRPEAQGSREVVACESGELVLTASGDALPLTPGDVATILADQPRQYANRGKRTVIAYRLLVSAAQLG